MAESSILPPQQHKQPSRKGKKAWRKNVDVTDINEGLEEVRDEVIKGGIIAEKSSAELFVVETTGSEEIQRSYIRAHKPLKADEILAQRSAVPAVGTHKRHANSNVTDGLEPSAKRNKGDYLLGKEYERLRRIAYGGDTVKKDVVQPAKATYDPWANESIQQPKYTFLEEEKAIREPGTLKHAPISMAKSGKAIAAVGKPEAGKSYNPVYEDWRSILEREGGKAVEDEMRRLEDERQEQELQARIAKAQEEKECKIESEWGSEWESEWEGIMSEREEEQSTDHLRKKRPERKTPAERNRIKRRKAEQAQKIHEGKMRTHEEVLKHARALGKAADARQRKLAEQPSAFDSEESPDDGEVALRRRRIGKAMIPEAPLEVVLVDELQDSLRRLKPEGNLLRDRFRSLIVRGKIESRAAIRQPKLPKTEVTEKWSYKDWKVPK